MNKDVIYIDVEDDITAIIGKVKASGDKIVALVPPKRIGVLQSAVNLRLLARAATQDDKRLVIITGNNALMSLAASANIPVAKNLQSKPELATVASAPSDDVEDDVIDGNDLPVGDHAGIDNDDAGKLSAAAAGSQMAKPPKNGEKPTKPGRAKSKVPNFNTFRKKLIIGIVAGILLIGFLIWAFFFAPRATIVVNASTNDTSVNANVTVGEELETSVDRNTIKADRNQKTEEKTVDFEPTGSRNLGERAKGVVQFSTDSISAARNGVTIPAGTQVSANGLTFTTDSSVTLTLSNTQGSSGVTAAEQGAKYNAASGQVSGAPDGVYGELSGPTSGGTDRNVKVVTESDIRKARESLTDDLNKDAEAQLRSTIKNAKPVDGSFKVEYDDVRSSPSANGEAQSGNATLTATVVYSMYSLRTDEVGKYLDAFLKKDLGDDSDQRVYDDGKDDAEFQDVSNTDEGAELTLVATAKVGPRLDEDNIKKQSFGRKTGEIQESLQSVQGIESVDVKYFPFWVSSVPNDEKKVNVQFDVNE